LSIFRGAERLIDSTSPAHDTRGACSRLTSNQPHQAREMTGAGA
jgi:hypothetical protein